MSETENLISENDASSVATHGSQSSMTGDSETEEEEEDGCASLDVYGRRSDAKA